MLFRSPLKVVEVYNTDEGRWRKRSGLREALMGVAIVVKGVCGGMGVERTCTHSHMLC